MDEPVAYQKNTNLDIVPQKNKIGKKLLFEILIVIILLILLLGALNYFNILSLSKFFPSQKPQSISLELQPTSTVKKNSFPSPGLKINCPSIKEFCQIGTGVIKDGKYIGWGAVLASGSAIFAAFDGDLSSESNTFPKEKDSQTTQKKYITAYLDSSELGLRGTYYFRGSISISGKVAKGEQIGTSSGKVITIYDNKSLIFSLISGYPKTNTPIILNKNNFTL